MTESETGSLQVDVHLGHIDPLIQVLPISCFAHIRGKLSQTGTMDRPPDECWQWCQHGQERGCCDVLWAAQGRRLGPEWVCTHVVHVQGEFFVSTRMTNKRAFRNIYQLIGGMETYLHEADIDANLLHLIKMRVSQINGCAFCLAMHAKDLRDAGEREDRIYVLDAWRETDWFTDRERAALEWAEALTILPNREVPDDVFERASAEFNEQELADLTLAVIAINSWNRLNIAFHTPPTPFSIEQPIAEPVAV